MKRAFTAARRLRSARLWLAPAALVLLWSAARAQDSKPGKDEKPGSEAKPGRDSNGGNEDAPGKTTLAFGAPPADWKVRPKETKPFVCDYDLPAAEGDSEPPRVNVIFYPMGFDEYRKKIVTHWTKADGTPLTIDDQKTEELAAPGDLKLRLIEQAGSHTTKTGAEAGFKLVAVHIRGAGGKWTVWLMGPQKGVDKSRDAYLAWCKSAHEVEAAPQEESAAVREVRAIHGAPAHGTPDPWPLVGYRIGKHALAKLGLKREQASELVVTERSPREPRSTSMLDGLLAATGCTPGNLNLVHETAAGEDALEIVVLHKTSKRQLTYKLVKTAREKIHDVDPAGYPIMAKLLDSMKDEEVFTVEESAGK